MTVVTQYRLKHAALTGSPEQRQVDLTEEPARHRLR
jgi:hypothetical protein